MARETPKEPTYVYKFRKWNDKDHQKWVFSPEIYFSSPDKLNDPFDSRIHPSLSELKTPNDINGFLQNQTQIALTVNPNQSYQVVYGKLAKNLANDAARLQKTLDQVRTINTDHLIGICSFSRLRKNTLLWSHYADNSNGFCIGYDFKALRQFLGEKGIDSGFVDYATTYPLFSPMLDPTVQFFKQYTTKAACWRYEKEYRAVMVLLGENPPNRITGIPINLITEIIMGLHLQEDAKQAITKFAIENQIKLKEIFQRPRDFTLRVRVKRSRTITNQNIKMKGEGANK